MNPIIPPLKTGDRGDRVANLQDALLLLLERAALPVSDAERRSLTASMQAERNPPPERRGILRTHEPAQPLYGDGTTRAVTLFQQTHRLPAATGQVDDPTATALNAAVTALTANPAAKDTNPTSKQPGAERQHNPTPVAPTPRGQPEPVTAEQGRSNPHGAQPLNPPEQAGPTFSVSGKVISRERAGVGGLTVEIADKNPGENGDVRLAGTTTGHDGAYQVTFSTADLQRRAKQRPDLQTRVLTGQKLLGISEVRYDASARETLDVLLTGEASSSLPSEHATLTDVLSAHFKGNLRDLKESNDRQDVTYLANKTGWDARAVALAALADQFSAKTKEGRSAAGIDPPFFYALLRAGVGGNEDALYQVDTTAAERIWRQAVAQGVISAELEKEIPRAVERFHALAAQRALDGPPVAGLSSLKQMLSVSLGDDAAKQKKFADIYARHKADPPKMWEEVRRAFGEGAEKRLRVDGQLGYLTLNNAPLIRKLHTAAGRDGLTDTVNLARNGFYKDEKWRELIAREAIPADIPGQNDEEKRARYAEMLAAQVRLSFPTMVVAEMVKSGETPVGKDARKEDVHAFLAEHHGRFEIGQHPVRRYIARNKLQVSAQVAKEIARVQRVYQITPSDTAMNALLKRGVDSALAVSRYDRDQFIRMFKDDLGGEANARLTHAKAQQVHGAVFNIASSYLVARTAPQIGVHSPAKYVNTAFRPMATAQRALTSLQPASTASILGSAWAKDAFKAWASQSPENAGDVIAYATLENLFGEMDYCSCEHCRSVLSPAAYLVDLLHFLDRDDKAPAAAWTHYLTEWKSEHQGATYPYERIQDWQNADRPDPKTLLQVLLDRRPDIQFLPLTCKNTNTPLPYTDLVNETLEHFVIHDGLAGFGGNSTDANIAPEELLASPQVVQDAAYGKLKEASFPPPLPFHQPLEALRRYFDKFETPLPQVMEALRKNDNLDRSTDDGYGWRDILMEELRLSRAEYRLLTDRSVTIQQLYGFESTATVNDVLFGIRDQGTDQEERFGLAYAKAFSRRTGVFYEEIVELLKTRFVNPGLPPNGIVNPTQPVDGLITLYGNPDDLCNFDKVEFRYYRQGGGETKLQAFDFVRMIRFIRLWKKLGWTIEQTDKAITALYPANPLPKAPNAPEEEKLDAGFLILLPRLGVIKRVMDALKLKPKKDLPPLLACFAPIDIHGLQSLYRQMFFSPAPAESPGPFAADKEGDYLPNGMTLGVETDRERLRAAFLLTDDELSEIARDLGYSTGTLLKLDEPAKPKEGAISAIFRRGWLARKLKLSVRELLLLIRFTGIDPFDAPDPPDPANKRLLGPGMLRLIEFVDRLRAASLKPEQALYLIWNQDLSGKSAPEQDEILGFARTLRAAFAAVESEFALIDDPTGEIARARMALVYGNDAATFFFALLDNTFVTEVQYAHSQSVLEQAILDAGRDPPDAPSSIGYDDFRKQLSFSGVMTEAVREALLSAGTAEFKDAISKPGVGGAEPTGLYHENKKKVDPFFERYPELKGAYDNYVSSTDPVEKKRSDLLHDILPELKNRRKRQQALQAVAAAAGSATTLASTLLDNRLALNPASADETTPLEHVPPALDDLTAVDSLGSSIELLPDGWNGYLEAPENGFYKLEIATPGATSATFNGEDLHKQSEVWTNQKPIELLAGTLYAISVTCQNASGDFIIRWEPETKGRGREVIPSRFLYSATAVDALRTTYVRFLKAASLATALKLTPAETVHFATHADYRIDNRGCLQRLPVKQSPQLALSTRLLRVLDALIDFSLLKARLSPNDERLLSVLRDPEGAAQSPTGDVDNLLFSLTRWEKTSREEVLRRLSGSNIADVADLAQLTTFRRIHNAFVLLKKLGIPAKALISAATNEPDAATVRAFKAALRARYDEADWLGVLRPINDALRSLQRDALVAHILQGMGLIAKTRHIDTPDKLFEYFLMDVQMDPCMQTSRIRHALSSVQLFIERCFLNLEPRVAPAVFSDEHRKQWAWMKRYRVWEANRKVFLWPENWLEPELRDDQSPFFKEAMSELLQSDITEERAATALLNYLSKLEEVAKLEPCGMHVVEPESEDSNQIVHVVARTAGANRKYYYRRREGLPEVAAGTWTPWELIKLDIEDNPIIPVVWKGRLFLFSLRILKQAPLTGQQLDTGGATTLQDLPVTAIKTHPPEIDVRAILCWSEYYNGKWQATKTSNIDAPAALLGLGRYNVGNGFDRSKLTLISLEDPESGTLVIDGFHWGSGFVPFTFDFLLYNSHSLPVRAEDDDTGTSSAAIARFLGEPVHTDVVRKFVGGRRRGIFTGNDNLEVRYYQGVGPAGGLRRDVLKNTRKMNDRTVVPRHILEDPWMAPFFYEDSRHAFYVTPQRARAMRLDWYSYPFYTGSVLGDLGIRPIVIPERQQPRPPPVTSSLANALGRSSLVRFGNVEIGIEGRASNTSARR